MGRYLVWALGVGTGIVLGTTAAAAQTRVDISVFTPNVGARVIVGSPRVYVPAPVYVEPVYVIQPRVYVERDYYYRPYVVRPIPGWARGHRHARFVRAHYDPRPARRIVHVDVYRDTRRMAGRYRRW